jgi:hypothetical protein
MTAHFTARSPRPTWATVARQDLANELRAQSHAFITEANLWHNEPGHNTVARAASQLAFMAQLVLGDSSDEACAEGEAWLRASRTMLPKIQRTRERRTLGASA